ncbi:MAG: glutathione peroxidase [Eubacteriales bacterium]|nr:glutathione peroxidase [Eubacteriales bacterium]
MTFYDFSAKKINGATVQLSNYAGQVVLVVNTASKCGFTPQFKELEELYQKYQDQGLVILGFPTNQFAHQDPGTDAEILTFCQVNYGVTFPMFEKIDVNGAVAHPLFVYLKSQTRAWLGRDIKWNFTKFLIDRNGHVIRRFAPAVSPIKIERDIEKALQSK